MPITTDSYYLVVYNETEYDKIGLSKTIDNYTSDEIKAFTFCAAFHRLAKNITSAEQDTLLGYAGSINENPLTVSAGSYEHYILNAGNGTYNTPNGLPFSIVWLCFPNGTVVPHHLSLTDVTGYSAKIITELDAPKYIYHISNPTQINSKGATSWDDNANSLYNWDYSNDLPYYQIDENTEIPVSPLNGPVVPFMIIETDGAISFVKLSTYDTNTWYSRGQFWGSSGERTGGGWIVPYNYDVNTEPDNPSFGTCSNIISVSDTWDGENAFPYDWNVTAGDLGITGTLYITDDAGRRGTMEFRGGSNDGWTLYRGFVMSIYPSTRDEIYLFIASCGIKFKTDKVYKPVISGGWVIGYSDDMSTPSELDDWHGSAVHAITPTPPTPPHPSGDIETDMPLAYIGGTAGMVDFIRINASGLASADDISDAISRFDITTIGKDLLRNFVSFKCFAVLNIDDSVVRDIKVSGHTLKDEKDHALQGEYIGSVAPVDFSAGKIDTLYNDYRDYAPYTRIQMYVPFCGWFDLPSWCMGKEITGTMFTDLYNGTVKAVIYASRTVVAEVGGCCAFDIPFAAESTGTKAGAVISSALSTIAMTGATIAAPNIATGIAAVSSAANFISAANSNGTTLKGVMGDGSNTNGLLHVYIKTTRPNSPDGINAIPDKYKHENGIPCYKQLKLTAGDGYTQIMDANITGAMTDREKQMIIDGFRHGLIL